MRAKCGEVLAWHWAHLTAECDPWSEPESQWHLAWKARFPDAYQEVVVGPHRADVKGPAAVLEVQKSQIAPDMIREREEFYGQMLWMLKGDDFAERFTTGYRGRGVYWFEWKTPRKTWASAERRLLIDFGEIFEITRIDTTETPWVGRGRYVSGVELYEAICGKGAELVDHQWYAENCVLHLARRAREDRHDAHVEQRRLEEERRIEEFQRQRDAERWEREQAAAARVAADLERQRQEEIARRKSAEEYERYLAERKESEAREERLRKAAAAAQVMMADVQWFALEQRRGQIYSKILNRRPYPIWDVGHWSTKDLQDLLLSLERRNITADFCEQVRQQQQMLH